MPALLQLDVPGAEHVATVHRLIPSKHRLALPFLDWSGARVSAIDRTLVGDYDEAPRCVRLRKQATNTRKALWIDLPPVLADALEASLPPREDRDPRGPVLRRVRRRRVTDIDREGLPRCGDRPVQSARPSPPTRLAAPRARDAVRANREWLGQRNLSVTADTYTHVNNETELDYGELLAANAVRRTRVSTAGPHLGPYLEPKKVRISREV